MDDQGNERASADRSEAIASLRRMADEDRHVEGAIMLYEENKERLTKSGHENPRAQPTGDEPPLTAAAGVEVDLNAATTAVEILFHLSRLCWLYRFPGAECPETQIMTLGELIEWLPKIPRAAGAALWPAIIAAHAGNQARAGEPVSTPQDDPDVESALPGAIELIHREKGDVTIVHLLFSVVTAWQDRITEREPFSPRQRGSLARLSAIVKDPVFLGSGFPVDVDAPTEPFGQLSLPGLTDTTVVAACTSWLLWLFDKAGGSIAQGSGAPWDMRLWVYAMLHLAVEDRDGLWHTLRFKTEEVIGWLHPDGWTNQRRDWENLPTALNTIREKMSYVPVPGLGTVAMLFPSVIPSVPSHPLIEFTIRVPFAAANGDRLYWPLLIAYGAESTRLFRAYLAVTAWLGRFAHNGHPITRQIAQPVLGPDGKPLRRKRRIVRSDTFRKPNFAVRYVEQNLTEHDLSRMIGFDETDRRRRHDARSAFERMDADGVIDLQRSGSHFAIFGPTRDQLLRREGAAGAAELLHTALRLTDPLTRAKLVDRATGVERRAVIYALRDAPRDEPLNTANLKAAARKLESIPS